jgi:hypothetical protein
MFHVRFLRTIRPVKVPLVANNLCQLGDMFDHLHCLVIFSYTVDREYKQLIHLEIVDVYAVCVFVLF